MRIPWPGCEKELPNWGATPGAFGEHCRLHYDIFMPTNEVVSRVSRTRSGGFSQRSIRSTSSKSGFATNDSSAHFRTIFGSSAEHSFDHYAELAGETRDEGERARCMELRAVRCGRPTVFDRFPSSVAQEE
jgi:hypothetical protein